MADNLITFIVIVLATSAISITVSTSKIFKTFRLLMGVISRWLGDLINCYYCFSHWVAFTLVFTFQPHFINKYMFLELVVESFAVVALSTLLSGKLYYTLYGNEEK